MDHGNAYLIPFDSGDASLAALDSGDACLVALDSSEACFMTLDSGNTDIKPGLFDNDSDREKFVLVKEMVEIDFCPTHRDQLADTMI
jgi:hypothetical protein